MAVRQPGERPAGERPGAEGTVRPPLRRKHPYFIALKIACGINNCLLEQKLT